MRIVCKYCGYEWEYKGKLFWVTCPNCMKKFQRGDDNVSNERANTN